MELRLAQLQLMQAACPDGSKRIGTIGDPSHRKQAHHPVEERNTGRPKGVVFFVVPQNPGSIYEVRCIVH